MVRLAQDSLIFQELSGFFVVPPLTVDEVARLSATEIKELLVAIRAQRQVTKGGESE